MATSYGPDLTAEGGFELPGYWFASAGRSYVEDPVNEGTKSSCLTSTAGEEQYFAQIIPAISSGTYYRLSFDLYRTTGAGYVNATINWWDADNDPLPLGGFLYIPHAQAYTSRPGEHTGAWTRLSATLRCIHTDLAHARIRFAVEGGAEVAYFDDVQFQEVTFDPAPDWTFPDDLVYDTAPSQMGMEVENVSLSGGAYTITTTGCVWVFNPDTGALSAYQRIGAERTVLTATISTIDPGPWTCSTATSDVVVFESATMALAFHGDSLLTIATNVEITVAAESGIGAEYYQRGYGVQLAMDDYGGFMTLPYARPELASDGTVLDIDGEEDTSESGWEFTYTVAAKELLGISVFPPRPTNEDDSYQRRIVSVLSPPSLSRIQELAQHASVLMIFAGIYDPDHPEGETHAPYALLDEEGLIDTIDDAHDEGMEVILYRHPMSYAWIGETNDDMIDDMNTDLALLGHDGWYLDGHPSWTDWLESYKAMRTLRISVGSGILYTHGTVGPPLNSINTYCPFIDTYCDFILRGEGQVFYGPTSDYFKYVVDTRCKSNSIATIKGDQMRAASGSETLATTSQLYSFMEDINGRSRWAYPADPVSASDTWVTEYVPKLDRMKARYELRDWLGSYRQDLRNIYATNRTGQRFVRTSRFLRWPGGGE